MFLKMIIALMPKKIIAKMFTLNVESARKIEAVITEVEQVCEQNSFALLHYYNYHEIVASKGFPIERKVYIYEVCQARVAAMMLTTNPHFAPFMPCRIAIYEDNGTTVISTQNMQIMLDSVKKEKNLYLEASQLFTGLQKMMKELKG
jgi:uncharacterized protein (DUF302 family)